MTTSLILSPHANTNYCAKVVKITQLRKHENADRLLIATIDGNSVIVGLDTKEGDTVVFFPVECEINTEFLSWTNAFTDKLLNENKEQKGFFEKNCRVRCLRLRKEKSEGYIVNTKVVEQFFFSKKGLTICLEDHIGEEFDTIGQTLLVKKYQPKRQRALSSSPLSKNSQKRVKRFNRVIADQFRFHQDTSHLGKYIHLIHPSDLISVTNKLHGTSFIVSNTLCNRPLSFYEKVLKWFRLPVIEEYYDILYASRKVVKNGSIPTGKSLIPVRQHYYKYDLWKEISFELEPHLTEGLTFYGEAVGFTRDGSYIQKGYDYGAPPNTFHPYLYRITFTNVSGKVFEFSWKQLKDFCQEHKLRHVPEFYYGYAKDLYPDISPEQHWRENFLQRLSQSYLERDCNLCVINTVPAEGIVLRREAMTFQAYKHKSFRFRERETQLLDKGETNIEDDQGEGGGDLEEKE